jgi:hypothetical protein
MSVSNQQISIQYGTDGMATAFTFPSYFIAQADLLVQYTDSLGNTTNLVLNSDYTVAGTLDDKLNTYNMGGTVNFSVPPAASGTLLITRQTPVIQPAVFNPQDPFSAGALEATLDRMVLVEQELWANLTRG